MAGDKISARKKVNILGVTGSIGHSARDVILSSESGFDVQVVTANSNAQKLAERAIELKAQCAVIADETQFKALSLALFGTGIEARAGAEALCQSIPENSDLTISAITGMAGLKPLLGALQKSKTVAIANKEPLVAAGNFILEAAKKNRSKILPIDSEHNALFQVFDTSQHDQVSRIVLTASGGPFLSRSRAEMKNVTPSQALLHPTWSMGKKISIDSATMMNKALEVIEAHILFALPWQKIDVLVHPQSIVHAMVEYADGSVLAQLGASDMRTPIAHALAWPARMQTPGRVLGLKALKLLEFSEPDLDQFPALGLGYECLKSANSAASLVLNAANEIAVEAFLLEIIGFLDIAEVCKWALENFSGHCAADIESAIALDGVVRTQTKAYIDQHWGIVSWAAEEM